MKTYTQLISELSLGQAGSFAASAHTGQHRKMSGAPYIVHPTAVMRILQSVGVKDKNVLVAAFVHDTIEDTPVTYNDLKREFNKEVADFAKEVTSNKRGIEMLGKPQYLAKKMVGMSDGALAIKLADRLHNTTDLNQMPHKKAVSYAEQTKFIFDTLRANRRLCKPCKKLMKQIEMQIERFLL